MFDQLRDHYRRPDQLRAIEQLSNPRAYPGAAEQKGGSFLLQVYVMPSFYPITSWTIYKQEADTLLIRRVRWDFSADYKAPFGEPSIFCADAVVASEELTPSIAELGKMSFPVFAPAAHFGLDGTTFGIRSGKFWHKAEFCWWFKPPAGCEAVAVWHESFCSLLERFLPAHTVHSGTEAIRPEHSHDTRLWR